MEAGMAGVACEAAPALLLMCRPYSLEERKLTVPVLCCLLLA